jgi:glycine cleavage system H protein
VSHPADRQYSKTHQWARRDEDGNITVGITNFAQDQLGDVVYIQNPAAGTQIRQGEPCGVIESVKTASDVHAPVSGEVIAVNEALADTPEQLNAEPYAAWLFRVKPAGDGGIAQLLDADTYGRHLEESP